MNSNVVIIFTPILWGGYSYNIKKFMDRNISCILPFFMKKYGETHHVLRYKKYPEVIVIGYGEGVTEKEKRTFKMLMEENSKNLSGGGFNGLLLDEIEFEGLKKITEKFLQEV